MVISMFLHVYDVSNPVGKGCRIHQLYLCRGVKPHPNECAGYETKPSEGEAPVLEL